MAITASLNRSDEVSFERINQVGLITLNRPQVLNALSHAMVQALMASLDLCEQDPDLRAVFLCGQGAKAFCAGGDVIAVVQSAQAGTSLQQQFFLDEYRLNHRLAYFPKPIGVLMHGFVMGGGMGLAQGASLRLVTPTTRIAMPETRIGLVPDVGASHFFARIPAPLALYLALTGVTISAPDALFVGFADGYTWLADATQLAASLQAIDWLKVDRLDYAATQAVLAQHLLCTPAMDLSGATLPRLCPAVYRHFAPTQSVAQIMASLAQDQAVDEQDWAQQTLNLLRTRSPLMLALCQAALQQGRRLSLADSLRLEYDLVQYALRCGEMQEGVRAFLIDKDQQPNWQFPHVQSLPADRVATVWQQLQSSEPHPLADLKA